jgi:hypothetical protein
MAQVEDQTGIQTMTRFLASEMNPDGFPLEDLLLMLRRDVLVRSEKIVDDPRPEARTVLENDIRILQLLTDALRLSEASTALLNRSFGPSHSSHGGEPRIGHL